MSEEWEARLERARRALAPALTLVGDWIGSGTAHGDAVTASMHVQSILGKTVLKVWERVAEHEDLSLYRFDPDDGLFKVVHLMAGHSSEYPVEWTGTGLVWVTPPAVPAVEWIVEGAALRSIVLWPGAPSPEVEIRYERRGT